MKLFIFILFVPIFAEAKRPTFIFLETASLRSFDFDRDGRVDYLEKFSGKTLIETLYDSDSDGVFDRHTILNPQSEVYKITDLSKTKSSPRKRISYWNHELRQRTVAHVQLDRDNDGVWDISYETSTDIRQKAENCSVGHLAPGAETLAQNVLEICLRAEDYLETDFGYRIHASCLEGRPWFLEEARSSLSQGRACLAGLAGRGMRGAARNLSGLESILMDNNVQILCNESYDWGRAAAHATTGAEDASRYLPLVHPGISLGPQMLSGTQTSERLREFRSILFHEQLHNLGNRHGVDPEISYTCSTCCFPASYVEAEDQELACRVCGGDYSSITDPQYLEDISVYAEANFSKQEALGATLNFLRENNEGRLGLFYLATNMDGVFNPVGTEIAAILSQRQNLSGREREILARVRARTNDRNLDPYRAGAQVIAQAYLNLFEDRNPQAALRLLRENASLLRQQFNQNVGINGQSIATNLKEVTDTLLAEVWFRGYRGNSPGVQLGSQGGYSLTTEGLAVKDILGL